MFFRTCVAMVRMIHTQARALHTAYGCSRRYSNVTTRVVPGASSPVSRSSFVPLLSSSVQRIGFREQSIPSFRTSRCPLSAEFHLNVALPAIVGRVSSSGDSRGAHHGSLQS